METLAYACAFVAAAATLSLYIETRRARREARTDALTNVGNKRAWLEVVAAHQRRGIPFSFVLFDVANLKALNTAVGHERADRVLEEVGCAVRATDRGYRIGGDEFALFLPGESPESAAELCERVEREVGVVVHSGATVFVSGCAGFWRPGLELERQLERADRLLELRKATLKAELGLPLTRSAPGSKIAGLLFT